MLLGNPIATRDLTKLSLFTAWIIVLSIVPPVPVTGIPVPVTMQTLAIMLTGLVLPPKLAGLAVIQYVLLAAIGLPVLPGGRGGLGVISGPTGGFLLAFVPGVILVSWIAKLVTLSTTNSKSIAMGYFLACVVGGVALVYLIGTPWLAAVTNMSIGDAAMAVLVFLPGDLLKGAIASVVAIKLRQLVA
jgi:biotin transport system substrate-specific component